MTAIDLGPLLAPVAGANPAGQWLRHDPLYADIRRMREADDPNLPQGVWKRELKRADWRGVEELAYAALATRSKDLLLAAWLTEAWLRRLGFAGFAAGLRLMTALCRGFWNDLYPPLDGGSAAGRVAPVHWVAQKLVLPLKDIVVTAPAGDDSRPLTWADGERARYYENLEKSHPESAAAAYRKGAVTHPEFIISASRTPAAFFAALAADLAESARALDELEATLVRLAGDEETPSFAPLRDVLDAVEAFVERMANREADAAPPPAPAAIANPGEALLRLREAAEFLLRTQSPEELRAALSALPGMSGENEEEPMP
jgi:type VI secretion system protein ImpA